MSRTRTAKLGADARKSDPASFSQQPQQSESDMEITLDESEFFPESYDYDDYSDTIDVDTYESEKSSSTWLNIKFFFVISCITLIIGNYLNQKPIPNEDRKNECNFHALTKKYPEQNEFLWRSLQAGYQSVAVEHKASPFIYLFAHINDSGLELIGEIVKTMENCIPSEYSPVSLSHADFASPEAEEDYGVILDKYHDPLKASKVMLVTDLNKISANVAQAFHTICDTVTPFVEGSIIFLTIRIDPSPSPILQTVEEQLRRVWSDLEENKLQPLVTRVTDVVLLLN